MNGCYETRLLTYSVFSVLNIVMGATYNVCPLVLAMFDRIFPSQFLRVRKEAAIHEGRHDSYHRKCEFGILCDLDYLADTICNLDQSRDLDRDVSAASYSHCRSLRHYHCKGFDI